MFQSIAEDLSGISFSWCAFGQGSITLLLGAVLVGCLGRLLFGRRSVVRCAVSSAIGILFLYAATVIVYSSGVSIPINFPDLPFVSISQNSLHLFSFQGASYAAISAQFLSLLILALLFLILDRHIPEGGRFFSWLLYRALTVLASAALYLAVMWLLNAILPQGLLAHAPGILVALLLIMLLTGALKILIGIALTTVNPIIGGLYTFFFSSLVGRQISKSVCTATILTAMAFVMDRMGNTVVFLSTAALVGYIPFLIALLLIWYIVRRWL